VAHGTREVRSDQEVFRMVKDYQRRNPDVNSWSRGKTEMRREVHARGEKLASGYRIRDAWKKAKKK